MLGLVQSQPLPMRKSHSYMLSKSLRVANQTDSFVATGIQQSEACVIRPWLRMVKSRAQRGFQIRGSQRWLWGPGTLSEKVNREETGENTTGLTLLSWRLSTIPRHPKKAVWSENKPNWAKRTASGILQGLKLLHHIQGDYSQTKHWNPNYSKIQN